MANAAMLTTQDLDGSTLFDELVERLNADRDVVAERILSDKRDSKRFFTGAARRSVWARDDGFCRYCGKKLAPNAWEADHVVPWARGGQTVEENGAASCPECNNSKSDDFW